MIIDPTQPLPDQREEQFARMVAAGVGRARAYEVALGGDDRNYSAWRQQGYRLGQVLRVKNRIAFLRQSGEVPVPTATELPTPSPPPDLSRAGLLQLMGEVTQALRDSVGALELVGGTPASIARLRRDLLAHVKRVQKFEPAHAVEAVLDENFVELAKNMADLRCRCATRASERAQERR